MDATFLLKNAVWLFGLSLVGVLGCAILLAVSLNMYRQERRGGTSTDPTPRRPWAWPAALRRWNLRRPAAPLAADAPAPTPAGAPLEVLRVLRHPLTGRLLVEIAGRRYAAVNEITDPDVVQGLEVTQQDLTHFLGAPRAAAEPPAPAPSVAPQAAAPAAPADAPPPAAPADAPSEAPAASPLGLNPLPPPPAPKPSASQAVRVPSMNPFKQMQILREIGPVDQAPLSIAEQIDAVLQHLIAGTPYAARKLQVRSGPRGAVLFAADGREHDALEALPDADTQAVFREAIRQWEARS